MVKMIVGLKGSGKTKTLINLVNTAAETTKGAVVCIQKGSNLIHEITRSVRLINADDYNITTANSLYGFVCGVCASNYDITDIFVDGTMRICQRDLALIEQFVKEADAILAPNNINLTLTLSLDSADLPDGLKAYVA
ncbi:MAG: hypothetical protein IKM34_00500 [Clostridia bacterium]|nr:hypothetical protein [Clostridia bacterium]